MDFVQLRAVGLAALFFTSVSLFAFRHRGPWGSYWSSLVIILLGLWAAQVWIEPMGPVYGGVAWLPLLLAGIYLSVLLMPAGPIHRHQPDPQEKVFRQQQAKQQKEDQAFRVLNASFWLLLLGFAVMIVLGYATKV